MLLQASDVLGDEKRNSERVACNLEVETYNPAMHQVENVRAHDFSAKGIRVVSKKAFALNDDLDVKIYFSGDLDPLVYRVKVAWVKYGLRGFWHTGFKFLKSEPASLELVTHENN